MRRRRLALLLALPAVLLVLAAATGVQARVDELTVIKSVNARFHSLDQAKAAGYVPFYRCTEQPGVGTMGQHWVRGDLVADPAVDPLNPEALVYEPTADGGSRLVAVEYVVLDPTRPAGAADPTLLGKPLTHMLGANRYGLPTFWQRHLWLYKANPLGVTADWNPTVSCRGTGDHGG